MNVSREVIIDLLPLYIAGEASPDTRALIDEYLKQDPALAESVRSSDFERLANLPSTSLRPGGDTELESLRRTRSLLTWERRLYAWAVALSLISFSSAFSFNQGHVTFRLLLLEYPQVFGPAISLALSCWIGYFFLRRGSRITKRSTK